MTLPFAPIPSSELDDLHRRLSSTRPARLPEGVGASRGTDADLLAGLLATWRSGFDWRVPEARILALPWTTAAGLTVVHQRSAAADAPVVVLLHGWPDSVLRFERLLPLLTDLHVVVPALPGFPFAQPLTAPGTTVAVMAEQVAEAMAALGHERYTVSAGDVGGDVAEQLAARHPDRIRALHLTNVSPRHALFADRSALDAEGRAHLDAVPAWQRTEGGYIAEQSTKPHTLAPGLADSPAGLAAWLTEKLQAWSDVPFADEDLLTWIAAYWFTNTIGTSFGPYVESVRPVPYVATPTVLSVFAHDIKPAPRAFAEQFVHVVECIEHEDGGHFAAWEQPQRYAEDLRTAVALGASA